jgi:hypothetical protein
VKDRGDILVTQWRDKADSLTRNAMEGHAQNLKTAAAFAFCLLPLFNSKILPKFAF